LPEPCSGATPVPAVPVRAIPLAARLRHVCGTSAARLRHVCGTSAGRREEDQWTHRTLDKAINSFNGAALQLDVTKEVSTTDVAKGVRLLALGFKDLADALKR
jgi:hypothetical protein